VGEVFCNVVEQVLPMKGYSSLYAVQLSSLYTKEHD